MQKPTIALLLITHSRHIKKMLEDGESAIAVQQYLKDLGHPVSINFLRRNLRKCFPAFMSNGRFAPMQARIQREFEAFQAGRGSYATDGENTSNGERALGSVDQDTSQTVGREQEKKHDFQNDPGIEPLKDDHVEMLVAEAEELPHPKPRVAEQEPNVKPLTSPSEEFTSEQSASPEPPTFASESLNEKPKVILTLRNGVTIDEDVKERIGPEEYRILSERYVHMDDKDEAVRMLISKTVGGRDYLREKHDELDQLNEKEGK